MWVLGNAILDFLIGSRIWVTCINGPRNSQVRVEIFQMHFVVLQEFLCPEVIIGRPKVWLIFSKDIAQSEIVICDCASPKHS